jgi:sortase A
LAAMVALSACGSLGQSGGGGNSEQPPKEEARKEGAPEKLSEQAKQKQVAPQQGSENTGETANAVEPPKDTTMKLTVPKLDQIDNDEIPTGLGTDETLFRDYAAVHLKYTGYPWEEEGNVYIAGHRLGYKGTPSHLAFYDLEDLKNGDEVYITDSEGRRYIYEVYDKMIVEPTNLSVLAPVKGKNIVSLQTCTLPDYTDRVIIRGELKDIREA